MSNFPSLQGEATTGKAKVWSVRVFERDGSGVIETSHGYLGGKIQVSEKIISQGKNIGKKNETSPLQQAISEAKASWTKKKESGYSEHAGPIHDVITSIDHATTVVTASRGKGVNEDVPFPMLAHEYQKRGKGFVFPCYTQPKLDGTRAIGIPRRGIFSRLRKTFPHLEHIRRELDTLSPSMILDGELYSDKLTFQEIVGIVKRETLKLGDHEKQLKIKYYIYDLVSDKPFEERYNELRRLFSTHSFQHLVLVPTLLCDTADAMKEQHRIHVTNGYEGIMLRNKSGLYKHARSVDLLKYKEFFDAEYEVVGFKEGDGVEKGCVIWLCKTDNGEYFHCRPRGSHEERMELFTNGEQYIGKKLTVRYQEETDDGLPRFPVGIAFRDYE